MTKHPKRPRDTNQLAKAIADLATVDGNELAELQERLRKQAKTKKPHKDKSS